jgi:hypothetical protein
MAVVATLWIWFRFPQRMKALACSVAILAFVLVPLGYRTQQFMHIFSPLGIPHLNLIYGLSGKQSVEIEYQSPQEGVGWVFGFTSPALQAAPLEPLSEWRTRREGTVKIHIDIAEGGADWRRAMWENFPTVSRYLWMTGDNLILLFFSESWPDSSQEQTLGRINYWLRWLWLPLTVLCVAATFLRRRELRGHYLLASLMLAWFVMQGLLPMVPNEGRYRKPFEGLLVAQLVLLAGVRRPTPAATPADTPTAYT